MSIAASVPYSSTCTEWSITRSTGWSGLIFDALPPSFASASRMAARSTTHGTPVKSCSSTRAVRNAISLSTRSRTFQVAIASTSAAFTNAPSSFRRRFSRRIFRENGSVATELPGTASSASRRDLGRHREHVGGLHERAVFVSQEILEENLQGERERCDRIARDGVERVEAVY